MFLNSNELQNPFNNAEELEPLFKLDYSFAEVELKHKRVIRAQIFNTQQSSLLLFMTSLLKKATIYASTHASITLLVLTLLATSVSASAAQLLAPEEFKPITLVNKLFNPVENEQPDSNPTQEIKFNPVENEQPDSNPTQEIKEDKSNEIVVSEVCGINIKFPKQIGDEKLTAFKDYTEDPVLESIVVASENWVEIDRNPSITTAINPSSFSCSSEKVDHSQLVPFPSTSLTKQTLKEFTGWLIADADLIEIEDHYDQRTGRHIVQFKHGDYWYSIWFWERVENPVIELKGLFASQFQVQLQSQVQETPTIQLTPQDPFEIVREFQEERVYTGDNGLESSVAAYGTTQTISIPDCGLDIGYSTTGSLVQQLNARYGSLENGSPDQSTVEVYTKQEYVDDTFTPVLEVTCSKNEINWAELESSEPIPSSEGLLIDYLTPKSQGKIEFKESYILETGADITLESDKYQANRNLLTYIVLDDGTSIRIAETEYLAPALGLQSKNGKLRAREKPQILIQLTSITDINLRNEAIGEIPPEQEPTVSFIPTNASELFQTTFDSKTSECATDGMVGYTAFDPQTNPDSQTQRLEFLDISVKAFYNQQVNRIIDRVISTEGLTLGEQGITPFSKSCQETNEIFLKEFRDQKVSDTDISRSFVVLEQQDNDIAGIPVIHVLARKGNHYIRMTKSVYSFGEADYALYIQPKINACLTQNLEDFNSCYKKALLSDINVLGKTERTLGELTTTFNL